MNIMRVGSLVAALLIVAGCGENTSSVMPTPPKQESPKTVSEFRKQARKYYMKQKVKGGLDQDVDVAARDLTDKYMTATDDDKLKLWNRVK